MTFVRVMVFSILVLLVFTGFANILPQVQSDPPAEEVVETGSLDMAGLVAYGETLFSGKGTCTLCHNNLGRAPDLLEMDLAATFKARIGDAAGDDAGAVEAYLRESLLDPSAYVVAGFGKKGSDDKVSPMPAVDAPPIELDAVQIDAVIAFLQDRAGLEPTVALPSADDAPAAEGEAAEEEEPEGPATDAVAALDKFYCAACHDLEGSEADAGPDLRGIASRMSREKVMEAVFDPNAEIAEGFEADTMPADFAEQMYVSELTLIVDYLMNLSE
jgi:mono/diheme cytochrome c family protein